MTTQEQIDRVLALVAKADPKNGATPAERESALALANKLRAKYGLTKEQLLKKTVEPQRPQPRPQQKTQQHPSGQSQRTKYWFDIPLSILYRRDFHTLVTAVHNDNRGAYYNSSEHRFYSYDKEFLRIIARLCDRIALLAEQEDKLDREIKQHRFEQKMRNQAAHRHIDIWWCINCGIFFGILLGVLMIMI